jgi:hypothetical protein
MGNGCLADSCLQATWYAWPCLVLSDSVISEEQYHALPLEEKKAIERLIERFVEMYDNRVRLGENTETLRLRIHNEWSGKLIASISCTGLILYI